MYNPNSSEEQARIQYYKRRYNRAYTIAVQWWAIEQACYHFAVPCRDLFYWTNYSQGAEKNGRVYDTTAVWATRNFVSKIQNALTPPKQTWASLVPGTDFETGGANEAEQTQEGEIKDKVSKLCEKFTETVFKYIKRSNFDLAIAECYFDLAVGTACLMVNEGTDEDPLRFHSVPMNQLCVEDSINGMINTVYRTYGEVRIIDIPMMWPKAKLPVWAEALLEQDPNVTIKNLYEGVVYIQENEPTPFRVVLWCDSDILMEYDDVSSPWIVFRWSKINNEAMGRGPLMDALPSILSLNELARLELTSANLNVCKPYMAYSDGVFSPYLFNLQPNTIIPIAPNAAGQFPIQPLPDVANPQFFQMTSMDLRQQINNLLYANPLGQANDGPTRTATELALRQRNLSEEIGPVFTRLQSELLDRVINRIVYILKKKGLIEPIVINGRELDLKYQSPLVVAQGQLEVQGFLQYFQAVQGVYGPEGAITTLNPGYVQYWMAEKLGVDMRLLADRDKFNASLKSNSEQYQQAQLDSLAAPAGLPGTVPQ